MGILQVAKERKARSGWWAVRILELLSVCKEGCLYSVDVCVRESLLNYWNNLCGLNINFHITFRTAAKVEEGNGKQQQRQQQQQQQSTTKQNPHGGGGAKVEDLVRIRRKFKRKSFRRRGK